jgi:hypothetical protein
MRSLASHREQPKRRQCRFARGTKAVLPRAVRPLAASAPPQRFVAGSGLCAEPSFGIEENACLQEHSFLIEPKNPMLGKAEVSFGQVTACSESMQALRRSAKPNTRSRAATSFARGGGFGVFAGGVTQRTMRAGCVPQSAMPNHSINRTCPGKPGHAGYLKR